ncbi:MAG: DUF2207 domain-containing protein [Patescibacteria group bacterium]
MNKSKLVICAIVSFLVIFPFHHSVAQSTTSEHINSFDVSLIVNADSTIDVTETIEYNFENTQHHGMYQYIPYEYTRDNATYTTDISVQGVEDENGIPYTYEESRSSGFVSLQIGDADTYVTGVKIYVIHFTVERAINYFDDHDEVYWNVTGNDWEVPIDAVSAHVSFPTNVAEPNSTTACYTGAYGSNTSACDIQWDANSITFTAQNNLAIGEGLSVVVGFPKGVVAEPTALENALRAVLGYWYLIVPVILFIFLHMRWVKRGRDPKGRSTVVPQYEPPEKMTPSTMGALWDESADTKDISAALIFLAIKGLIKIKDLGKKDYEFMQLPDAKNRLATLEKTEQKVFDALFASGAQTIKLSSLKNKFYKDLPGIKESMYASLVEKGYYTSDPAKAKKTYYTVAGVVFFGLMFTGGFGNPIVWFAGVVSAILLLIYGKIMPQKTVHGAEIKEEVQGFRWFLSVTETERLKFHNAPEKKPDQFMEFLPYAMVFGVEKAWAAQFKDMYIEAPGWYEGQPGTMFTAIYFGSMLSSMNSHMGSTFTSHPSSAGSGGSGFGGGGFSGGGFGGGGGGSW